MCRYQSKRNLKFIFGGELRLLNVEHVSKITTWHMLLLLLL